MIAAMLAARTREDFVAAVRALDRVLISGYYVVPLFYLPDQWVARWTTIEHPQNHGAHRLRPADMVAEACELSAPVRFSIADMPLMLAGMSADPVTIDVISDVVCPWCYLGKRRLARAIGLMPEINSSCAGGRSGSIRRSRRRESRGRTI